MDALASSQFLSFESMTSPTAMEYFATCSRSHTFSASFLSLVYRIWSDVKGFSGENRIFSALAYFSVSYERILSSELSTSLEAVSLRRGILEGRRCAWRRRRLMRFSFCTMR